MDYLITGLALFIGSIGLWGTIMLVNTKREEPEESLLELSSDDGDKNTEMLNEALKQGDVKLKYGNYPVSPTVVVNNVKLDLNGSTLTSTKLRYTGVLISMCGESPCVCNGILRGNYSKAPGEEGYVRFEGEGAIGYPVGGCSGGLVDGVTMRNFCGYAVCPRSGGEEEGIPYTIRHFSSSKKPDDNRAKFTLSGMHKYVSARHAVGYNYYISDSPVKYEFEDVDGNSLSIEYGIPGESIEIPSGASCVWVSTFLETYKQYGLFEYLYDNSITINNCTFICNQRLAIANLAGESVVSNCTSKSNGYPREDHSGLVWDSSTSGFMDIEDIQTPILTVINSYSENENLGVLSRAYKLIAKDCRGVRVSVRDGWEVYSENSNPITFSSASLYLKVKVHGEVTDSCMALDKDCDGVDFGNVHIYPVNGAVISNSTYNITTKSPTGYGKDASGGVFDNCTFNLSSDWILCQSTISFTFKNCTIHTNGYYMDDQYRAAVGTWTFENCTIDDPTHIDRRNKLNVVFI